MRAISPAFLGYSFLEVWSFCVVFNRNRVIEGLNDLFWEAASPGAAQFFLSGVSALAVVGGTLILVLLCRKRDRIARHGVATVASTVLNVAGTALILSGNAFAGMAGFFCAGLGNAWLWIVWGDVYARLDVEALDVVAIGSVVLQALVMLVVFALPPLGQAVALLLSTPLSCALYLWSTGPGGKLGEPVVDERSRRAPVRLDGPFALRLVVGLGLPIAGIYYLWDAAFPLPLLTEGIELVVLIGLLAFALIFFGFLRFAQGFGLSSICGVELALIVVACLLSLGSFGRALGQALVFGAVLVSQYFVLVYCARLCNRGFGNVVFTFGLGELVNHGFGWLGTMVALLPQIGDGLSAFGFSSSAACVLCAAAFFAMLFLQSRRGEGSQSAAIEMGEGSASDGALKELAASYGLSARETEVFVYLARGRSAPFIRDELMVSLNTVTSHIKHIYGKMGIHSRQELIDLVDGRRSAQRPS